MAKNSIDKSLFNDLKDTLAQVPETPTQKITAIGVKKTLLRDEEAPFTLWVPKKLMKQIKMKALNEDASIKEVIIAAIKKDILN